MRSLSQQPFQYVASLGLVTDGSSSSCNSVVHRQGLSNFFTTPVDSGKALHLYDVNLNLKGASKPLAPSFLPELKQQRISFIAAYAELTFAAIGSAIVVYHRLRPLHVLRFHTSAVTLLSVVSNILISVAKDSTLIAWSIPQNHKGLCSFIDSKLSEIQLPPDFTASTITHPATYLNKILVGSDDGRLMLINLKTESIIHTFQRVSSAPITVLHSSPVPDVVAIGTAAGKIILHNIKADKTVLEFQHATTNASETSATQLQTRANERSIVSVSFMSGALELLVSTDCSGEVFVWDLNERRLCTQLWQVHHNGIRSAFVLPGEPLLVTFGRTDNAIRIHVFEERKNAFRLLRSRDGHSLPPTVVQFAADDGLLLVSAGLDHRLRLASLVNEARNTFFSQPSLSNDEAAKPTPRKRKRRRTIDNRSAARGGSVNVKLPPVSNLVLTDARTGSDANILTTHLNMNAVFTWDLDSISLKSRLRLPQSKPRVLRLATARKAVARHEMALGQSFNPELSDIATFVQLSTCGNFAHVGSRNGRIHSFNVQSGVHQGAFKDFSLATDPADWGRAHTDQVRCLAVDTNGETLASVATGELCVKLWNVFSRTMDGNPIEIPSEVISLQWCKSSNLLALGCEDFSVLVCDASTRKVARRFIGHQGPLVGITFDNRGRRIISAAEDNTIRAWDLASGQDVGCVPCEDTPTSIALAPNNSYLASTHANCLSIKVWADTSEYAALARADSTEEATNKEGNEQNSEGTRHNRSMGSASPQLTKAKEGMCLSSKPSSHWTVLKNIKQIKDRNKPTEAPKKPRDTPFFISERLGSPLETSDAVEGNGSSKKTPGRAKNSAQKNSFEKAITSGNFKQAHEILFSSDSSGVDYHMRSSEGTVFRQKAIRFFIQALKTQSQFELVQAYLTVFLQEHGLAIAQDEKSSDALNQLLHAQRSSWASLRGSLDTVSSLCSFFSGLV